MFVNKFHILNVKQCGSFFFFQKPNDLDLHKDRIYVGSIELGLKGSLVEKLPSVSSSLK